MEHEKKQNFLYETSKESARFSKNMTWIFRSAMAAAGLYRGRDDEASSPS